MLPRQLARVRVLTFAVAISFTRVCCVGAVLAVCGIGLKPESVSREIMRALPQVTQSLQSDQTLQVLHDFVAERQGGDGNFSFIVPGPPGLRQELGEEKLSSTLEELGLAPSASLTVQATSKKDLVTAAPEGAQFVSVRARRRRHQHLCARERESERERERERDRGTPIHTERTFVLSFRAGRP
jgi:hypothetical protein